MMNYSAIPQSKLNALLEEVCRPINFLATQIDSATPLWDEPIKMYQKIEGDPFEVYNILEEALKHNSYFNGINTPRKYHVILCRVYILLYYRRKNNLKYEVAFSVLKKNMGVYGRTYFDTINERIDNVLKKEELLKKYQVEEKKYVKPVFAYVAQDRNEMDNLYIEYNEEELFRGMSGVIRTLTEEFDTEQDEANVWFNAKRVVQALRDVPRPELLIERAAKTLEEGQWYNGSEGSQIILLCAYAMIRSSKNHEYFDAFIKRMEDMSSAPTDLQTIQRSIRYVKKWVDEHPISDGYDYIGEPSEANETFSIADVERIRKQIIEQESAERQKLQQEKEKLELKVQELEAQLAAKVQEPEAEKAKEKQQHVGWTAPENNEVLVNLLTPIFYQDREAVIAFLKDISGLKDVEVADKVVEKVKAHVISDKSNRRELWKPLNAANLYRAGETNWNTYMKRKGV